MIPMDESNSYDSEYDRRTVAAALDWYILRHLEDQRHMPKRQRFLEEDRQYNDLLNRYTLHQLKKEGMELEPVASTLTESLRPADATHYIPRYFPDEELDSALVMYKHELIVKRLLDTIAYLNRIMDARGERLGSFSELMSNYTPFVPDAYVTFYNDLVAEADDFDRELGIREKMRKLAVRMIFPAKEQELNYWKERTLDTYQVPTNIAREAIEGWFYLTLDDIPTA